MKSNYIFLTTLMLFGLTLLVSPVTGATLDGQTVQTTYLFPDTATVFSGPTNAVVAPGVELSNFAGFVNIDFSDTNVLITTTRNAFVNNVSFDGLRFTDINGTIPGVVVTINAATNYAGFDASRVSLSGNSLFVNLANLPGLQGQVISLDITAVPEPSDLALVPLAVGVLCLWRVRRSRVLNG